MPSAPGFLWLCLLAAPCHAYLMGAARTSRAACQPLTSPTRLYMEGEAEAEGDLQLATTASSSDAGASEAGAPSDPPLATLEEADFVNTKWKLTFQPRPEGWLSGGTQEQEFALLQDGSVVWGGTAGGFGTGGRWQLRDETLEVIRTTPLGLVTGRDYYMSIVRAEVTSDLQFEIAGITRSYNALFPVTVVADWTAKRLPGRFARDTGDDDDDAPPPQKQSEGLIDSSGFKFPSPSDFGDFGLGS